VAVEDHPLWPKWKARPAAVSSKHTAQTGTLRPPNRAAIGVAERSQQLRRRRGPGALIEICKKRFGVSRDEGDGQILFLRKVVVNTSALDTDIVGKFAKTYAMIALRSHRDLRSVQQAVNCRPLRHLAPERSCGGHLRRLALQGTRRPTGEKDNSDAHTRTRHAMDSTLLQIEIRRHAAWGYRPYSSPVRCQHESLLRVH
jgi:hypothetical protein